MPWHNLIKTGSLFLYFSSVKQPVGKGMSNVTFFSREGNDDEITATWITKVDVVCLGATADIANLSWPLCVVLHSERPIRLLQIFILVGLLCGLPHDWRKLQSRSTLPAWPARSTAFAAIFVYICKQKCFRALPEIRFCSSRVTSETLFWSRPPKLAPV